VDRWSAAGFCETVKAGAGISTERDPLAGGTEAATLAAGPLAGRRADLVLVFASGEHLAAPEATLAGVTSVLETDALIGCGAGGVMAGGRELESGTGVSVWAASFDGAGAVMPFHAELVGDDDERSIVGLPELGQSSGVLMVADPYSFPIDAVLTLLTDAAPAVPVLGGLASARTPEGHSALFAGGEVRDEGAVGVSLEGIEMLPCVSQGAAPVGREVTITAAEGNLITELAGRPALATVEQIVGELPARERALLADGLLIGIVIDGGQPEYEQGDFLVRGVIGGDPASGSLAVGANVRPGQVLRIHARDARSADEDLRRALRLRLEAMGQAPPAGAIVFSCNGRGRTMFGVPDHDAAAVQDELEGAPAAGFFAAGEIGPVGGRSFLHAFTATLAVFPG
jgi:small ligand-binding sensory domain FIST